ncbi:MAG: prolyl oligopeptidase family serine peptidase, partial [Acidobacteria bacterium]|nr:prolyl oligopeptidase family serine peptidase [Acidobacteriota bacterium]
GRWLLLGTLPAERNLGERTPMPVWVTESGDVETRDVRVKVGSADPVGEALVLLDLEQHVQHELDLAVLPGIDEDPLAELRAAAAARDAEGSEAAETVPAPEPKRKRRRKAKTASQDEETPEPEPRPVRLLDARWSRDGAHLALLLRSLDNKDRWLATVDFESTALRPLHHLHDPAWINWRYNDFGWLLDDKTLYYLSEEGGYSGLYTMSPAGGPPTRLAGGAFAVSQPQLTHDGQAIYYRANAEQPGVYEIYRVDLHEGESQRVTTLGGMNSAELSHDGQHLLIEHSTTLLPPELYVQRAVAGATATRATTTTSEAFLAVDWTEPSIVEIPSTHAERGIYSRLYLPPAGAGAPGTQRPAVMFIHGAGYLQNAPHGWSGYFREFMFHTLLSRRGYVFIDMDYRASAGYGRDWRTAIYRRMGTPELEDLQDGVTWLVSEHGVDPERIGVYGGSYGGFMVMMALFKDPALFAAGAALRPVTDWAHYNHGYTSNILNTPEIDPEAYARSSPIEFAGGLEKPLLICAPMLDDNVFFQDTVRLVQRLIELEKTDFETALFPVEPHGFREPSSWLNEYRRIYDLFERYVRPVSSGDARWPVT